MRQEARVWGRVCALNPLCLNVIGQTEPRLAFRLLDLLLDGVPA
jgi:hypothetical protein